MDLLLTQTKYIEDLLHKANMTTCKSLSTPATPNENLQATGAKSAPDITLYRTIVGALQYLNITRPDIAFSVHKASQYVHSPKMQHWVTVKHILHYLKGTQRYGLLLTPSSNLDIHAYSDADWASNLNDRKSISGYAIFMGSNLISWQSKKQPRVACSSAEADETHNSNLTWLDLQGSDRVYLV
ncbi:uncharacterized mitochondrial protein AtMg00810-like [Hevea brasiliensis]|uniref:uncharacterized mitochondrial protein AtMg00810-like n=1 Tax=Hevea brasiliensis TaxID=3981 RepID=UPI0025FCB145|nr:uncharacterized mitochondrial protein AtMg00810-like [Hevea brasiliensis]